MMSDYVYRVVDSDDEIYWVQDPHSIRSSFGTVLEVTKFQLVEPRDITDEVNGDYLQD